MNKNEEQIKDDIECLQNTHVEQALRHLRNHESDTQKYLADYVASLCEVDKSSMFSDSDIVAYAHARWLYWYAYRYMTNDSFKKIAQQSFHGQHTFSLRTIQNGANRMAVMIDQEPIWKKRWTIIKRIIKLQESNVNVKIDNTIVISVPRELKDLIRIAIKDK